MIVLGFAARAHWVLGFIARQQEDEDLAAFHLREVSRSPVRAACGDPADGLDTMDRPCS